jgi:hypothetical protein
MTPVKGIRGYVSNGGLDVSEHGDESPYDARSLLISLIADFLEYSVESSPTVRYSNTISATKVFLSKNACQMGL